MRLIIVRATNASASVATASSSWRAGSSRASQRLPPWRRHVEPAAADQGVPRLLADNLIGRHAVTVVTAPAAGCWLLMASPRSAEMSGGEHHGWRAA